MAQIVHVEPVAIPEGFRAILLGNLGETNLAAWETRALVVEAARQHIISRNKAATLLGFEDYESREEFFNQYELFNEYTVEMLDEDFRTIDQINL